MRTNDHLQIGDSEVTLETDRVSCSSTTSSSLSSSTVEINRDALITPRHNQGSSRSFCSDDKIKEHIMERTNVSSYSSKLLSLPQSPYASPNSKRNIPKTKSPISRWHVSEGVSVEDDKPTFSQPPPPYETSDSSNSNSNSSTENFSPKRGEKPSPITVPDSNFGEVSATPRNCTQTTTSLPSVKQEPPPSTRNSIILTPTNSKFISQVNNIPLEVDEASDSSSSDVLSSISIFTFLKIIMQKTPSPNLREAHRQVSQHNLYSITRWFSLITGYFCILFLVLFLTSDSSRSILVFFGLFPIEIANNMVCNYVTCCKAKSVLSKSVVHIVRSIVIGVLAFIWQYYYYDLPFYLLTMIKQIIACHVFGEEIMSSSIASIIISTGAVYPLYVLNYERKKLIEIAFLMTSASLISLFLAYIYAEEKRNHYKQRFAYMQEKYVSNEKTHMIANISHEARNPLHGIIGASTILRHDMEKSSHTDKRKKRGRKNSILHSPCSTKGGLLHVMSEDGHYSSDCESSSGESTEQPYLELVNDIYNNANLLLHIFSTSLQMTSLEMGNIKLKNEAFNLLDTIESVVSVFYNIAADKNVSLHSFVDLNNLPNQVMGDHVRVSQILMNFISNSIKYSSSESGDSSVVIKCGICPDEELEKLNVEKDKIIEMLDDKEDIIFVKIDCIDNGKGIERENISNLFKAFQIFDLKSGDNMESSGTVFDQYYLKSISGNSKGSNGTSLLLSNRTGVGLNISKQLIEKMKGCIIVSSEVGKGTTMSVIFPFKKSMEIPLVENIMQNVTHHKQLAENLLPFNIIIIDSEVLFLKLFEDYIHLLNPNVRIDTYVSAVGISKIDESKPVIVIYSESAHYEVKQIFKQVEKILIPIGHRGRMRRFSNMRYIVKPLKVEEIVDVLHEKMERHKKRVHQTTVDIPEICVTSARAPETPHTETSIEVVTKPVRRVLITDDNLINRKVMEKMVRLLGFTEIDLASNGLECFEMYKQKQYSIILLDLLMPVMCGKQSVKHIREYEEKEGKSRTPVIAITANIWESVDALSEIGFDSIIYKPILIEKLREEIEKLTHNPVVVSK